MKTRQLQKYIVLTVSKSSFSKEIICFALIVNNPDAQCRSPLNDKILKMYDVSLYCRYNPFRRKLIDKERSQNASPG